MDRNPDTATRIYLVAESLSARRAWIEIKTRLDVVIRFFVALRKESVDRNIDLTGMRFGRLGRSPQGERG